MFWATRMPGSLQGLTRCCCCHLLRRMQAMGGGGASEGGCDRCTVTTSKPPAPTLRVRTPSVRLRQRPPMWKWEGALESSHTPPPRAHLCTNGPHSFWIQSHRNCSTMSQLFFLMHHAARRCDPETTAVQQAVRMAPEGRGCGRRDRGREPDGRASWQPAGPPLSDHQSGLLWKPQPYKGTPSNHQALIA